jgi:SAM-dependent methyltransferase
METRTLIVCPACGAAAATDFAFGPTRLNRCGTCGLVYASEFGDPDEIYVDGYLSGDNDHGVGLDVTRPEMQQFLQYAAARRLALIERVIHPPGALLDVGCGSGEVLRVALDRGWCVDGVDPVPANVEFARTQHGLDVRLATLEESGLAEDSYDVVTAFHVLEHMTDGPAFLRTMARWARPGGYVAVEVPNWRSVHRRGYGGQWPGLRHLQHAAYYSPATLAATMRRAGLEPVRVSTLGFLWQQQTADQMLADLGVQRWGRWVHRSRVLTTRGEQFGEPATMASGVGWQALTALQAGYDAARVGMVVVAVARRPLAE